MEKRQYKVRSNEERFWEKVDRRGLDECWPWLASTDPKGYGWFRRHGEVGSDKAHRVSWEIHNGPVPDGLMVCHRCDVPACVNPAHLFVGTSQDNNRDRHEKGRTRVARFGDKGNAIMTWDSVDEIREVYTRAMSGRVRAPRGLIMDLADEYRVSTGCITGIVRGRVWVDGRYEVPSDGYRKSA